MTLKKNSPGCVCCSTGVATYLRNFNSYNRYNPNTQIWTETFLNVVGETVYIAGIDIENKYILYKKASNGEIWMYNPATNVIVGKLWEGTADIGNSSYNAVAVTYMPSWGIAYGVVSERIGSSTVYFGQASFDSAGDFIKGPYTNANSNELACDSSGTLYIAGQGSPGANTKYGIYIDADIQDSFSTPDNYTIEIDEDYSMTGGVASARYRLSGLVHDGTNLYADITSYSRFRPVSEAMDTNGICIINGSGEFEFQIEFDDIIGENEDTRDLQKHIDSAAYNPLQDRFEGISSKYLTSPLTFNWYQLEEGRYIQHFTSANLPIIRGIGIRTLATGPPLLEEVWDEL